MKTVDEVLAHFGVQGMRWGVRKDAVAVSGVDRANRSMGPPMIGVRNHGPAPTKTDEKILLKATSNALSGMQSKASKEEYGKFNQSIINMVPQPKYDAVWQKAYDQKIAKILESHANKALKDPMVASVTASSTGDMLLVVGTKPAVDSWKKDTSSAKHSDNMLGVTVTMLESTRDERGLITELSEGNSMMQSDSDAINEVLAHFGVRGMRWGVRKDRTTRVKVGETLRTITVPHHTSTDAMKAHNASVLIKKHGLKALTNQELKDLNYRINLEQNFRKMVPKETGRIKRGRDTMEKMIWQAGEQQLQPYINKYAGMGLAKALGPVARNAV